MTRRVILSVFERSLTRPPFGASPLAETRRFRHFLRTLRSRSLKHTL